MDIALSGLRSVLLGALGGLSAIALAVALGWVAAPHAPRRAASEALVHTVVGSPQVGPVEASAAASETARRFIVEAAGASLYDAHAARLMRARGADAEVQALVALLLREHESAWSALSALARERGVALPAAPRPDQRDALALLHDVAEPTTRTRLFVRHLGVEAACAEIARFEAARDALGDGDASLRRWIEQTLPALRERAALSQRLLPRVAERRPMA